MEWKYTPITGILLIMAASIAGTMTVMQKTGGITHITGYDTLSQEGSIDATISSDTAINLTINTLNFRSGTVDPACNNCSMHTPGKQSKINGTDTGLVSAWTFNNDENSTSNNTFSLDYQGRNNMTVSGAAFKPKLGRNWGSYEFDGEDDYLESAGNGDFINDDLTISAWVNNYDEKWQYQTIFSKGKYELKEIGDQYMFQVLGDNSEATWGNNKSIGGEGPIEFAVYKGDLYLNARNSQEVYVYNGSEWSLSGENFGVYNVGMAAYDGKLYICSLNGTFGDGGSYTPGEGLIYSFDGSEWSLNGHVGEGPRALAVYGGKLYVANKGSDDIYEYDGSEWTKSGDVGQDPVGFAVYKDKLYITHTGSDDIYEFDGSSWSKSADVGTTPAGLAVYDGKLYSIAYSNNEIYTFDGESWTQISSPTAEQCPGMGYGAAVYDGKLYASCYYTSYANNDHNEGEIYVYNGSEWTKSGDVGHEPMGLAVYDGKVYSASSANNSVWEYGNGASAWADKTTSEWNHITTQINQDNIKIHVNGEEKTNINHNLTLNYTSETDKLYLGKSYGSSSGTRGHTWGEFFKGLIDEVMIYNRSLSGDEIEERYDRGRNTDSPRCCNSFIVPGTGLRIENVGNRNATLQLNSNKNAADFIGGTNPQFQLNTTETEAGSCDNSTGPNSGLTPTWNNTFAPIPTNNEQICSIFHPEGSSDELELHIKLRIPDNSKTGSLNTTITTTATTA
ncbi:MAG: LamG-like jellyroll fold domain-containing protein [Candidatus Woesearchaeota archaeon]